MQWPGPDSNPRLDGPYPPPYPRQSARKAESEPATEEDYNTGSTAANCSNSFRPVSACSISSEYSTFQYEHFLAADTRRPPPVNAGSYIFGSSFTHLDAPSSYTDALSTASTDTHMPRLSEEYCTDDATNEMLRRLRNLSTDESHGTLWSEHSEPDYTLTDATYADQMGQGSAHLYSDFSNFPDGILGDVEPSLQGKTHRRNKSSGSSSKAGVSPKFAFPPFMKRRHRHNSSLSTGPSADSANTSSSRTSSFTSAVQYGGNSSTTSLPRMRNCGNEGSPPATPNDLLGFSENFVEPLDRKTTVTPLLPPPVKMSPSFSHGMPSPIMHSAAQSPGFSAASSDALPSPRHKSSHHVQKKASVTTVASSNGSKSGTTSTSHSRSSTRYGTELPAYLCMPPPDKWSEKLGHTNYTILPTPYMPETFNLDSWRQLMWDREEADYEFCRHQARTAEHYGIGSLVYRLTEEKWAETVEDWNTIIGQTKAMMLASGVKLDQLSACGSAKTIRMPTLNPHVDGKFPKLGDEDIVGPMIRSAPPTQTRAISPNRRPSAAKILQDFKTNFLGSKNHHV